MMNANELRLDNWVMTAQGPGKVRAIEGLCCGIKHFAGLVCNDDDSVWVRVDEFGHEPVDPIPLTPEILEKCGFVLNNSVLWNEPFWCWASSPEEIMLGEDICLENVKHLHQLQNVFFAITNKELEVTSLATTL